MTMGLMYEKNFIVKLFNLILSRCLRLRSAVPSPELSSSQISTTKSRVDRSGNEPSSTSCKLSF